MRKFLLWGVVAGILLAGGVRTGYARTLNDVMASVEKGVTALKDIKGTQVIKFAFEKDLITAQNIFSAKTPNKFRAETLITVPGKKQAQKVITVCDGKYVWQHVLPPEEEKVIKMNLAEAPGVAAKYQKTFMETGYGVVGVEDLLKLAGADYDIKVSGSAKLDGKDVDVVEGMLKKGSSKADAKAVSGWNLPVPARIKYQIGVKDGFIYKTEGFDKAGKLMLEISYKNLKFNTGLADSQFTFKAPRKVAVIDATEVLPGLGK